MDKRALRRDYERRINRVLDYIEKHLDGDISLDELADVAAFSRFHFHRIFTAFVGETLSVFIRRIRVERAAVHLQCYPDKTITEIALDCGFSSSAVFARAFKERFDISATEWRESDSKNRQIVRKEDQADRKSGKDSERRLRYAPPYWLAVSTQTEKEDVMEIKIENMPATRAAYVRRFGSYDESSKQAWEKLCRWAGPRGLLGPQTTFMGISYDNPDITAPDRLRYDACITIPPEVKPEGEIGLLELPACRVAKARYEGPGEGIKEAYRELYGRWLPESGFVPASLPCFEIYLNEPDKEGKFVMDICVPVIPA